MTDPLSRVLRAGALSGALALVAACSADTSPLPPPRAHALVALYGTGELVAIDLDDGTVVDTFSPTYWANAVAVRGDLARAVSLAGDDGMIEEIDLTGATIAATGETSDALSAYYPYTAAYAGDTAAIISGEGAFATWTPPAAADAFSVSACLWDVAASRDGTRLFFADRCGNTVTVTDVAGNVLDTFAYATGLPEAAATSSSPVALAASPDGTRLYVASSGTDSTEAADDVMVLSVAGDGTLAFVKRVLLEDADDSAVVADLYDSSGMEVSPDGSQVWIGYDHGAGGAAVYRPATDRVDVVPFETGAAPCEIAVDWGRGTAFLTGYDYEYVVGTDEIIAVDVGTLAFSSIALPAGSEPTGIALY